MAGLKFHLGYFTRFGPPAWLAPADRNHGGDWWDGRYFTDLATQLESACFDFLFFEDTSTVTRAFGNTMDADLKHAIFAPKNDVMALLPYLAATTRQIGLIATASTSFYPPFLLARLLSSIDSLAQGRLGWNIVTSSEEDAAANYGMPGLPDTVLRYDMADEFVELAHQLWDSWEEGALLRDEERVIYTDPAKVHTIDYVGRYHRSRGPLNSVPSPQRHPVLAQAGASERGRDFAAKHAEVIFATPFGGVAGMTGMRQDIHRRMRSFGRDPGECKIFWLSSVRFTDQTGADNRAATDRDVEIIAALYSGFMDLDLSQFDFDEPIPMDAVARGHTSVLDDLKAAGQQGKSLRTSLVESLMGSDELGLTGTAIEVADRMAEVIDAVGGDGMMINGAGVGNGEYVAKLVGEFVPRLRELGVVRTEYSGPTLRENLRAF